MADKRNQAGPGGAPNANDKLQVISRIRLVGVDAQKKKDAQITGLELNVGMDEVKQNKNFLEIWFTYKVIYKEDIGHITLKGILILQSEEHILKGVADFYEKNHYFESPWAENVANNINFKCATEAIFPAKILDLPAPIMPPRITMSGHPEPGAAPSGGPAARKKPGQGVPFETQSPFSPKFDPFKKH